MNLRARNFYKNLLTSVEKLLEIRLFRDKTLAFTSLKLTNIKPSVQSQNVNSDKLRQAQQLIANKDKEIELN